MKATFAHRIKQLGKGLLPSSAEGAPESFAGLLKAIGALNQTFESLSQGFEPFCEEDLAGLLQFSQVRDRRLVPLFLAELANARHFQSALASLNFQFLALLSAADLSALVARVNSVLGDPSQRERGTLLVKKLLFENKDRRLLGSVCVAEFVSREKESLPMDAKLQAMALLQLKGELPLLQMEILKEFLGTALADPESPLDFNAFVIALHQMAFFSSKGVVFEAKHARALLDKDVVFGPEYPLTFLVEQLGGNALFAERHRALFAKLRREFLGNCLEARETTLALELVEDLVRHSPLEAFDTEATAALAALAKENVHFLELANYFLGAFILSEGGRRPSLKDFSRSRGNELLEPARLRRMAASVDLERFSLTEYFKLNRLFFFGLTNALRLFFLVAEAAAQDPWDVTGANLHLMKDYYEANLHRLLGHALQFLESVASESEFEAKIRDDLWAFGIAFDAAIPEHVIVRGKIKMIGQKYVQTLLGGLDRLEQVAARRPFDAEFLEVFFKIKTRVGLLSPEFLEFLNTKF